jgi:O-antigen/teichoic acid export membrane protein
MLGNKAAKKSAVFFLLKMSNTALASVWSFLLAYALVRIVGIESYAFFATVIAFASLVLQADLGISIRLFGQLRQNFLHPEAGSRQALGNAVAAALASYAGIAVLATLVFAVMVWGFGLGVAQYHAVYILLFAGSVLPLPWMILRLTANAFDHYVMTEAIDCVRRTLLLVLTGALVIGLPLMAYAVSFVLLWLVALAVLFVMGRKRLAILSGHSIRQGFTVLRGDLHGIGTSAALSMSEFLIYIHPYYVIPLTHPEAVALVAFDMFYKVTRFATTAYLTVSETVLPHQTRAYHAGDVALLRKMMLLGFGLAAVPMLGAVGIIGLFGDRFFGILLGHPDVVTPEIRLAICVMLVLMLVQTISGAMLAGIGRLGVLARRASTTLVAMLVFSVCSGFWNMSIEQFIAGYVAIYAYEAFGYFWSMLMLFREIGSKARTPAVSSPA